VNVADQAFVMFPEWSRQEIIVTSKRAITPSDFGYIASPTLDWRGAQQAPSGFPEFILREFLANKLRTLLFFILTSATLLLIGPTKSALDTLNTLLIQASTVFLSIYLIFTVSQSERLSFDQKLFNKGILHKYYADDKNVTRFAIVTIVFVFVNAVLQYLPLLSSSLSQPLLSSPGRWATAIWSALTTTMLFHTFFIVADYYLERTRDLAEREHIGQILHQEYRKHHPDKEQN
jgi:hypothetical protein